MAHAGSLIARSSYAWGIGHGRPTSKCENMAVVRSYDGVGNRHGVELLRNCCFRRATTLGQELDVEGLWASVGIGHD